MTEKTTTDFYQQVEDFILNTIDCDMDTNKALNNEIRLFLLTLINHHKKVEEQRDRVGNKAFPIGNAF